MEQIFNGIGFLAGAFIVCAILYSIIKSAVRQGNKEANMPPQMHTVCTACGASFKTDSQFCSGCGQKLLHSPQESVQVSKLLCQNCGKQNEENNTFCGGCGQKLV